MTKLTHKPRLTGLTFSVANWRNVVSGPHHLGTLYISRGHNWGGRGTSYSFEPTETGERLGLAYFSASTVKRALERITTVVEG